MKRKILLKIIGVTFLSLLLFFAAGIAIVYGYGKKVLRERLTTETGLVVNLLDDAEDYAAFDAYYQNDELRVTIISKDGEVLFESDTLSPLENHLRREEVQNALNGTPKPVERYSQTFDCTMTYYAVADCLADGTPVVVRLALRGSEISAYVLTALPFFLLSLAVSMALGAALAKKLSGGVSEQIVEIGESLRSLNEGQYRPLQIDERQSEFLSVLKEIDALSERAHASLRREEGERRKLTAVLENVAQGVVALNVRKETVFVNGSAFLLFGNGQPPSGGSLSALIEDRQLREKIEERLEEEEFSFHYDYEGKMLSVVGKRIQGEEDERALSYILLFTDTTGEKDIIRQKSEFFANASHELKTPITVMRGLAEILLSKENLEEQEKKQITRIHKESLRMAELISDMLKLSKLERSETEERVVVDLREIAEEIIAELAGGIEEKNLRVSVTGGGKVLAEPKNMFELLQNLCSNAVNYNKQNGWIQVEIEETQGRVTLRVSDGGIGIEKEHIPRLCERFYRVDKSRSKKTGGTGLGLAIVKHICVLYEAELEITSALGEGTAVTVRF